MTLDQRVIDTSHCAIALSQNADSGPACLLIHGNSSCKEVFRHQLEGAPGKSHRLIAVDLPGHGASANARAPERTYCLGGYADAILELARVMELRKPAVLGWSLGGHIGLDMIGRDKDIAGLMISGTPPITCDQAGFAAGFIFSEHMHLAGQEHFSEAEVDAYAHATCGRNAPFEDFLLRAVARTDGRARKLMLEALAAGRDPDQRALATESEIPLAIVNGAEDEFINNAYIRALAYKTLWDGRVHDLERIGHAPFWEAPERFNPIFMRFLDDVLAKSG